tara:strand:+ start:947 stop:1366 length:420 start_codon:yes stop_codon:yes gene_type:complete
MESVYYSYEGYCPVKKYLERYRPLNKDTAKEKDDKIKLGAEIKRKVNYIIHNYGTPTPFISKLRDYGYFEIRQRKNENILIRILYFRHKDKIVLLNAFEKPDNYDKNKERRKIEKQLEVTQEYKDKFELNPTLYEEYKK